MPCWESALPAGLVQDATAPASASRSRPARVDNLSLRIRSLHSCFDPRLARDLRGNSPDVGRHCRGLSQGADGSKSVTDSRDDGRAPRASTRVGTATLDRTGESTQGALMGRWRSRLLALGLAAAWAVPAAGEQGQPLTG